MTALFCHAAGERDIRDTPFRGCVTASRHAFASLEPPTSSAEEQTDDR